MKNMSQIYLCRKENFEYCSCSAVALAACQFSMRSTFKVLLFMLLAMEAGENLKRFLKDKDDERIKIAEKHHQKLQRSTGKKLNYEQIKGDQKTKIDEGETYGSGIF